MLCKGETKLKVRGIQSMSRDLANCEIVSLYLVLGNLSNHDGNKTPQYVKMKNSIFACIFHFLTFCERSCSFYDVK